MSIIAPLIGAQLDTASGTTQTVPYPAGILNRMVLMILEVAKNSVNTVPAPSSTLTWTQRAAVSNYMKVYTATYDGVATAPTVAVGGVASSYRMFAFPGVDYTNPILGTPTTVTAVQTNMRYPAMVVPSNNGAVITFTNANGANTGVGGAANFTSMWNLNSSNGNALYAQYWIQSVATNISLTDLVVTGGSSVTQTGITLALRALPGSGGLINSGIVNDLVNGICLVQ